MRVFGFLTVRTFRGGAGYRNQTATPSVPSCSRGGNEPSRHVGVGRAVVNRSISGRGPIQHVQFTRLQLAGYRKATFDKPPVAKLWLGLLGPRSARVAPVAPTASATASAATSTRLCLARLLASFMSGSSDSGRRGACVNI